MPVYCTTIHSWTLTEARAVLGEVTVVATGSEAGDHVAGPLTNWRCSLPSSLLLHWALELSLMQQLLQQGLNS